MNSTIEHRVLCVYLSQTGYSKVEAVHHAAFHLELWQTEGTSCIARVSGGMASLYVQASHTASLFIQKTGEQYLHQLLDKGTQEQDGAQ